MAMLRPLKAAHDDYSVVILAYVFCSIKDQPIRDWSDLLRKNQ